MSEPVQPSDLYYRLQDALGQLRDVQRTVTQLGREYASRMFRPIPVADGHGD